MNSKPRAPVILCVEDEADLRKDIADELAEAGYTVVEAASGQEALMQIEALRPDLVLCDISMPGLGGYDVLRAVKEQAGTLPDIPFVFLSALADPREVIEGKRLGADDYLVKPVDFDLMLATVEARLRQIDRIRAQTNSEIEILRSALEQLGRPGLNVDAHGFTRALDLIATGIILIDAQRRVCFANSVARAIAAENDTLQIGQTITVRPLQQGKTFNSMLEAAIVLAQKGDDGVMSFALARAHSDRDLMLVACAMPLSADAAEGQPVVALFVTDPMQRPQPPATLLSSLFGLTPTEARIALTLANGKRPATIAKELGIAPTTVAFHMRNIFQKTATNRQADLVALILAGPASLICG